MVADLGKLARFSSAVREAALYALAQDPPYRLSGIDPKHGMDCSGFVVFCLSRAGYRGVARNVADLAQYLYTEASVESATQYYGDWAHRLCAYFFPEGVTSVEDYTHIALPIGSRVLADMDVVSTGYRIPDRVPTTYSGAQLLWAKSALTVQDYGQRQRFWSMANVLKTLYVYRTNLGFGLEDFGEMPTELGSLTTTGEFVDETAANSALILRALVTKPVIMKMLELVMGMPAQDIAEVMDSLTEDGFAAGAVEYTKQWPLVHQWMVLSKLLFSLTVGSYYAVRDFWGVMESGFQDTEHQARLSSGIKVRYDDPDGVNFGMYDVRYMNPNRWNDSFVDIDVQTLVSAKPQVPSVPIRF